MAGALYRMGHIKNPPRGAPRAAASRAPASRTPAWHARPRWRIAKGSFIALGPGKADLLEAISKRGSISAAAAAIGMSYRRAWTLVDTMNSCFARPLVATSRQRRKGALLTPDGRKVLRLYRRIESRSLRSSRSDLAALTSLLRPGASKQD
jgi:molybdate transport system regulatory protein